MTTEISMPDADMGAFNPADTALVQYLGLNPSDARSRAVVAVCRRYNLDPLLKHVIVIPKGGVYITRDGLLHIAHRSGQFDGMDVSQPEIIDGHWVCTVSVYRKDMGRPFTFPGRYPVNGSNKQYAPEMAIKTAESHALRRAFDINGLPSLDERHEAEHPTEGRMSAADFIAQQPPVDVSDAELVDDAQGVDQ